MNAFSAALNGLPADFDAALYLRLNPDVAAAGIGAAAHYLSHGRAEGRIWRSDPLPADFDPALYLDLNPELARSGVDPALHYRTFGRREGRFYRDADPAAAPRREALVVFVHIGKTAGSSLNEVLYRALGPGIRHVETLVDHPSVVARQLAQSGWVSGHLWTGALCGLVRGVTDRPLRLFTLLRDPVEQICSAYNWLLVLAARGPAAEAAMPEDIRAATRAVAATDHGDPAAVIGTLARHGGLFLNHQARAVFGTGAGTMTEAEMRAGLARFEGVGLPDRIGDLAAQMTGCPGIAVPRENASPYRFDKAVFRSPAMTRFLARAHAADARLVALVRAGRG